MPPMLSWLAFTPLWLLDTYTTVSPDKASQMALYMTLKLPCCRTRKEIPEGADKTLSLGSPMLLQGVATDIKAVRALKLP